MVRKVKRTQPGKKKKDGIDPRLVALAGAAGAVAGRGIAKAKNSAAARKSVSEAVAYRAGTLNNEFGTAARNAAQDIYNVEYSNMPRASSAKMNVAKRILDESLSRSNKPVDFNKLENARISAAKKAGLSRSEIAKVTAKRRANLGASTAIPTERYMDKASKIRAASTAGRAGRRGAAAGAVGAATVAAIVQAVLKELNKK